MQAFINKRLKELEKEMQGKYLTEEWLGKILNALYPHQGWLHDKKFKVDVEDGKNFNFRPDYCCRALKLCVEFDGPDHFTKANVIQADNRKKVILEELGYKVVRIPYFVQLNSETMRFFFDVVADFSYGFEHGFISNNVTLPANFCEQGVWKFKDFLYTLARAEENGICKNVLEPIKKSLLNKIDKMTQKVLSRETAILTVVPSQAYTILGLSDYNYKNIDTDLGKLRCANEARSNLENNWNCTILMSSQYLLDQEAFDIHYNFNSKGNLSGYSLKMLHDFIVTKYTLLVEEDVEDEEMVYISGYLNDELAYKGHVDKNEVTHESILEFLFPVGTFGDFEEVEEE